MRNTIYLDGYQLIYKPMNESSNHLGYVLKHRYVMENFLNRKLDKNEIVHHIDMDKNNNSIKNLQLMDRKEHTKWHRKNTPEIFKHHTKPRIFGFFKYQKIGTGERIFF
jgi:hypothetical protein